MWDLRKAESGRRWSPVGGGAGADAHGSVVEGEVSGD